MAITMKDADAALSEARAIVETWAEQFMRDWTAPYTSTLMRAQLAQLAKGIVNNPGMAQYYQTKNPQLYAKLSAFAGQKGQGNNGTD